VRYTDLITEAWLTTIGHTDVYEVSSKTDLLKMLHKHWYLRGFIYWDSAAVWDGHGMVHPDASSLLRHPESGEVGVPVHLTKDRVVIRHHSSSEAVVRAMFDDVADSPIFARLYRGTSPEIWGEDNDGNEERLDNREWVDEASEDWSRDWGVY
jgi:hypothetical protein